MESATCADVSISPSATSVLVSSMVGTSGKNEKVSGGRFAVVMASSSNGCWSCIDCSHAEPFRLGVTRVECDAPNQQHQRDRNQSLPRQSCLEWSNSRLEEANDVA